MADNYAAKLDANNVVVEIIVIPDYGNDDAAVHNFCSDLGLAGTWIACSDDPNFRGGMPRYGAIYDQTADEFISENPLTL